MEISTPNEPEGRKDSTRQSAAEELGLSPLRGEEALERVVQLLARIGNTPMAAFWVVDQNRQFLAAAHGFTTREVPHRSSLAEQAMRQDDVFVVQDASKDPRFASDPMVTGSPRLRFFAGVAVRGRDRQRIGVLCLMGTQAQALEDAARAALQDLRVIVEDRLNLRLDVLHDPQTGTVTRRHFDETGAREWRRAMRALVPISVVVAEIDHVREFGGREGIAALDRGLRAAALAMQYSLYRPGDCVSRYDETRFAMLLPGTDSSGAVETAERVRSAVETLQIPFGEMASGLLTLSVGVSTVHSDTLSRSDLMSTIDSATTALRRSQAAGGNRWTLAGSPGELLTPA